MSECADCGTSDMGLVQHHVSYEDDETVPVCLSCHRRIHHNTDHSLYPADERPGAADGLGELREMDEELLDLMRDGRVTAPYAADETGYSLQYIRDRLARFVEHGNARKVYDGLYELVEDPRDDA